MSLFFWNIRLLLHFYVSLKIWKVLGLWKIKFIVWALDIRRSTPGYLNNEKRVHILCLSLLYFWARKSASVDNRRWNQWAHDEPEHQRPGCSVLFLKILLACVLSPIILNMSTTKAWRLRRYGRLVPGSGGTGAAPWKVTDVTCWTELY